MWIILITMLSRLHQRGRGESSVVVVAYPRTAVRQLAKEKRERERVKENGDEGEKE